ncbi:MAG: restriction endonuclease subunit S, partial [bacterium]|nr:restriction endonuclease subunit S [bacterium]
MSDCVKLKDVVKIIGGGTPSKSEKSFYENGTIKWATVGDMNTDLIVDTELKITEKAVINSSTNIITSDAIVIATRVGLGKVCYLESETAINQDLKGLLPQKNRLSKEYLYYFFKSISKYIIKNGTGATVKGVKLDFINNIDIPLPPLQEQQRIVSKLDLLFEKIDKAITLHQKNIDEANVFMGSVLNDVFGELEEKYEKKQLHTVIKIIGGGTPSKNEKIYWDNGNIKWATVGDMNVETIVDTELSITEIGLKNSSSNIIPKEAIIIATRVGLGKVCYLNFDTAINQDLKGLVPLNDK